MESSKLSGVHINTLIQDVREHPCLWDCMHQDINNESKKAAHFSILINKYQCDTDKVIFMWNEIMVTYFLVCQKFETIKDDNAQSMVLLLTLVYSLMINTQIEIPENTNSKNNKPQSEEEASNKGNSIQSNVNKKINEVKRLTKNKPAILNNIKSRKNMANIEPADQPENTKEKAYIEETVVSIETQRECEVFGQLIAMKLQHLNHYIRQAAMNEIYNTLHQAMLQSYACHAHSSMQSGVFNPFINPFIKGPLAISSPLSPTDTSSTSSGAEPSSS